MSPIELDVLRACHELTVRARELLPLLASALHVSEQQVSYTWAFRRCQQSGRLEGSEWRYFFHGLECDLKNSSDGRLLRIDFGPRGRVDTFTAWGVLQFVTTAVAPWRVFSDLKRFFAAGETPQNESSSAMTKMYALWQKLDTHGLFASADPTLLELQAKYTITGSDGIRVTRFPADISEESRVDCSVAHRKIISLYGHRLLAGTLACSVA